MNTSNIDILLEAFYQIGDVFTKDLGVWWFLAPIFILWIAMEVYLGEYKKEQWGFSSSLANSISFTWINIVSLRFIFLESGYAEDPRMWIAFSFLLYSLLLVYLSFIHALPERMTAAAAGPTPVYFLSILSVLWGQGLLSISLPIIIDLALAYIIIWFFWKVVKSRLGILGEVEAVKKGESPE